MKSEIKSSEGLTREIQVEIPAETVNAAFAETYHKFRKEAKIKGFRPGKVPIHVIKSKYGQAIEEEILNDLIEKSYPQAVKEHDLKVASRPNITEYNIGEGNPLTYTARVEVFPEIESIDYDKLTLPEQKFEAHDAEVKAVIDRLRKKAATIRPVEREVQKGDILKLDLEKTEDPDNVLSEDVFNDTEIDLDNEYTMPEFKEQLQGAKKGDARDITVDYPQDFSNKLLAGHKITYRCKIKEVSERVLPPEDDNFAKSQGEEFATMLELRLRIREDLVKQKEREHRQWQKQELMQQLVAHNQIPVPEAMVEKYLDSVVEDMKKGQSEVDAEEVRKQYRPMAVDAIRWNLLADTITEQEKIEVLQSDTENWIKGFAEGYNMEIDKAKEMLANTGRINEIRNQILEDKLFEFILSKAKFVPAEPEATITATENEIKPDGEDDKDDKITTEEL